MKERLIEGLTRKALREILSKLDDSINVEKIKLPDLPGKILEFSYSEIKNCLD